MQDAHDAYVQETQFGCKGTDFGAHLRRLFQEMIDIKGMSGATLFCDIASAFYSVVRQLILEGFEVAN